LLLKIACLLLKMACLLLKIAGFLTARVRTPLYRQAEELLWQLSKLGMVEELLGWLYIRIPAVHSFP